MLHDHSRDCKLSYEEIVAEKKLDALRTKMLEEDPTLLTHNF
jgi:hypothetical protein